MTDDEVLREFRDSGALMKGHFVLSSGLHSDTYLQCARIMMDAKRGARLCAELADRVRAAAVGEIDLVVSPALGAVLVGYEMGRQLDRPSVFLEREGGVFTLRRGFKMREGMRCLMVEDVVTTGLSSRECISAVAHVGGKVSAGACFIDRSGGAVDIGVPLIALSTLFVATYPADSLPNHLRNVPVRKLGSRGLAFS